MPRPVAVAVDLPRLELDRPFTYLLPDGTDASVGSLVSVPFHGRTVHGWVLGDTDDVPSRVLPVRRVLSSAPVFDESSLRLYRWMAERYVAPLASVIGRAHPPRVAGEEDRPVVTAPPPPTPPAHAERLPGYREGRRLLQALRSGHGVFVLRPLPDDEASLCVEAVAACLAGGRDAVVVVPEAEPLPATATTVLEAFGGGRGAVRGGRSPLQVPGVARDPGRPIPGRGGDPPGGVRSGPAPGAGLGPSGVARGPPGGAGAPPPRPGDRRGQGTARGGGVRPGRAGTKRRGRRDRGGGRRDGGARSARRGAGGGAPGGDGPSRSGGSVAAPRRRPAPGGRRVPADLPAGLRGGPSVPNLWGAGAVRRV